MFKLFQPGPYNPNTAVIFDGLNVIAEFLTTAAALTAYGVIENDGIDLLGQDVFVVKPKTPTVTLSVTDLPVFFEAPPRRSS